MSSGLLETIGNLQMARIGANAGGRERVRRELKSLLERLFVELLQDTGSDYVLLSVVQQERLLIRVYQENPDAHELPKTWDCQPPERLDLPVESFELAFQSWGRRSFPTGYHHNPAELTPQARLFNESVREKAWFWVTFCDTDQTLQGLVCLIKATRTPAATSSRSAYSMDEVLTAWFKMQRFLSKQLFEEDESREELHGRFLAATIQLKSIWHAETLSDFLAGVAQCVTSENYLSWDESFIFANEKDDQSTFRCLMANQRNGHCESSEGQLTQQTISFVKRDSPAYSNPYFQLYCKESNLLRVTLPSTDLMCLFDASEYEGFRTTGEAIRRMLSPVQSGKPEAGSSTIIARLWKQVEDHVSNSKIDSTTMLPLCYADGDNIYWLPLMSNGRRYIVFLVSRAPAPTPDAARIRLATLFLEWAAKSLSLWERSKQNEGSEIEESLDEALYDELARQYGQFSTGRRGSRQLP